MTSVSFIPLDANPLHADALSALADLLEDRHYSPHATGRILRYVAINGTLAGSIIEPEDEADAEAVFVGGLPEIELDSDAWDRDDAVIFDAEMLAEGNHPWPIPVVSDEDDRPAPADEWPNLESLTLPPICGGSPEAYQPTAEDWADYRQWAEEIERRAALARMDDLRYPLYGYE